jgi:hypothetical protein
VSAWLQGWKAAKQDWLRFLFAPFVSNHIVDGKYELVLAMSSMNLEASRPEALRALSPIEPHTKLSGKVFLHGTDGNKRIPREGFVQILCQTAFAPAPIGNASLVAYLETMRFQP